VYLVYGGAGLFAFALARAMQAPEKKEQTIHSWLSPWFLSSN
jgi:hypothetical protein